MMSIYEKSKSRLPPDPCPGGVSRSKSFAGLLSHRRTASASATISHSNTDGSSISSGISSSNSSNLSRGSVLGHSHSANSRHLLLQGLSATWSGKPPKVPRPDRAQAIFEAIGKALKECITLTQEDISNLKSSLDSLSVNSSQQLKAAERYLKRLEFQLSKLDELKEQYEVQQKMRDGVRTMAYAYVLSPGRERGSALHSVRSGYKECTDSLCSIEAELERMMGTFLFQMKGIQGFARLCPGDVFEITLKHSDQKWKSRGRILKYDNQVWDNQKIIFKALLGEPLFIKAVEVRGLGKNILLGNKYCETKELFSAHPQIMTINLNPSGSLKLNLIITWNPLHIYADESSSKPVPPLLAALGSPLARRRGPPPPIQEDSHIPDTPVSGRSNPPSYWRGLCSPDMEYGRGISSGSSSASSAQSSAVASPDVEVMGINATSDSSHGVTEKCDSIGLHNAHAASPSVSSGIQSSHNRDQDSLNLQQLETTLTQRWSGIQSGESSECCSMDLGSSQGSNVESNSFQEVLHTLISSLEDIQGQYPELQSLHHYALDLDSLVMKTLQRRNSTGSNISISVESALGCFDFLNSAIDGDELDGTENRLVEEEEEKSLDPELTAKTSDSGIASIARQLLDDGNNSTPSLGSSPQPPTTGSEQLDLAIITHLSYCQRLIEHLGSFGPLKCQEIYSLDKLRKQAPILGTLVKLLNINKEDRKNINGSSMLLENVTILALWQQITEGGDPLCITSEYMASRLEHIISLWLSQESSIIAKVAKILVCRIQDIPKYEPESIITVMQFKQYFSKENSNVDSVLKELIEEVHLIELLSSRESALVKETLNIWKNSIPSRELLFCIAHLLIDENESLAKYAGSYLQDIGNSSERDQVTTTFLEGLESEDAITRQGSCAALALMNVSEYIEQLAYLSYADENIKVRNQAKEALFRFGDEGRRIYEQSQLFTHGFQGLNVK